MRADHRELHRAYLRSHVALFGDRTVLDKALSHFGLPVTFPEEPPLAGEIEASIAQMWHHLIGRDMLQGLFLGAQRILTRRDGTFDFARGEGGTGALLLFLAERAGEVIVGSIVEDWVNEVIRTVQRGDFPGPLWLGEDADLMDIPAHDFVDCVAWPIDAPGKVYRRNGLVDALWQGAPDEAGALDLYATPQAWLRAWLDARATLDDARIAATMGLPRGGHGPAARASLVLDPAAIDWTRYSHGPLGLDGARAARVCDSLALAERIAKAQQRPPPSPWPEPAVVLVPQAAGVAA